MLLFSQGVESEENKVRKTRNSTSAFWRKMLSSFLQISVWEQRKLGCHERTDIGKLGFTDSLSPLLSCGCRKASVGCGHAGLLSAAAAARGAGAEPG